MRTTPLRYGFLVALLVCNALFFWDVEFHGESLLAMAFGSDPAAGVTQTRMEQSGAFTFANPTTDPALRHR